MYREKEAFFSKEIGELLGTNIWTDYYLYKDVDELGEEVYNCSNHNGKVTDTEKLHEIYEKIVILNPEVKKIIFRDDEELWHLLMGVISKFTIEDINWFIKIDGFYNQPKEYKDIMKRIEFKLQEKYNRLHGLCWVPCLQTLKQIEAKLK